MMEYGNGEDDKVRKRRRLYRTGTEKRETVRQRRRRWRTRKEKKMQAGNEEEVAARERSK